MQIHVDVQVTMPGHTHEVVREGDGPSFPIASLPWTRIFHETRSSPLRLSYPASKLSWFTCMWFLIGVTGTCSRAQLFKMQSVCTHTRVPIIMHNKGQRTACGSWCFPSITLLLGTELTASGLAAGTCSHWASAPAPYPAFYVDAGDCMWDACTCGKNALSDALSPRSTTACLYASHWSFLSSHSTAIVKLGKRALSL